MIDFTNERILCIIGNARSNWKRKVTNAVLIINLFGVGMGTAYSMCNELNISPDGYTTQKELTDGKDFNK